MINYFKPLLGSTLTLLIALISFNANAQFTYIGLGLDYSGTTFDRTSIGANNTVIRGMNVSGNIMARPFRNFGVGVSIGAPVFQKFIFNFENSPTTDGSTYYYNGEFSFGNQRFFIPTNFEYTLETSNTFTLVGRFFFGNSLDIYADLRYSALNLTETYIYNRPFRQGETDFSGQREQDIQAVNIDFSETFTASGAGLALGIMPHLSDYFYMDFSVALDYLNYNGTGFSSYLAYDYEFSDGTLDYVTLESRIPGNHLTFKVNLGFGVYF